MSPTAEFADAVQAVKPLDVAAYLRLHGWAEQRIVRDAYSLWTRSIAERGEFEAMLPLDRGFSDFGRRVRELVETLEIVEQRSLPHIIEDLTTPNADIIRARLAPDANFDGTLPLDDGATVFQQVRELVLAAACAAVARKPVFAKRKPDQAMRYLREQARIGQTGRGSYVITVLSPVSPALRDKGQLSLLPGLEEEPFPRKVVRLLAEALAATVDGARLAASSGELDPFASAVSRGVSANLCEAILGLNHGSGDRGVEFSFSWAPTRGAPPNVRNVYRLTPDAMPYLEEASRAFRRAPELEGVDVIGFVHKLQRNDEDERRRSEVTIVGTADGEPRSVVATLEDDLETLAIRAYEELLKIACVGELVRDGRSYRLRNPREVRIVDDP